MDQERIAAEEYFLGYPSARAGEEILNVTSKGPGSFTSLILTNLIKRQELNYVI